MPRPARLARSDRNEPGRFLPALLSRRTFLAASLAQAAVWLAACAPRTAVPPPSPTAGLSPLPAATEALAPLSTTVPAIAAPTGAAATGRSAACALPPIVAPTPLPYPGYTGLEPETGLHVTGPAQEVHLAAYRLRVFGKVDRPLDLTYDDVRCLPKAGASLVLECPGFFVDHVNLAGATIASVMGLASPRPDAAGFRLLGVDADSAAFSLDVARDPQNFLAYEWAGQPLPPSHGFPIRAAMPGQPGSRWIKWVVSIEVT